LAQGLSTNVLSEAGHNCVSVYVVRASIRKMTDTIYFQARFLISYKFT